MTAATGTVYALTDPRDEEIRYVGQTVTTLAQRLRGTYSARVRSWMAEVRAAGLAPQIIPLRENVPAGELLAVEGAEITRIIAAGGALLNEQVTGLGRKLLRERQETERATAGHAAWRELADAAFSVLGGPLPPGDLPELEIPEVSWAYMSTVDPDQRERARSLLTSPHPRETLSERYREWRAMEHEREDATRQLQWCMNGAWGKVRWMGGDRFGDDMDLNFAVVAEMTCASRGEASRHLALTVWYMVAMHPWRHLAELAGLTQDDETFIAWAGQDAEVREALEFLASRREKALERIPHRYYAPYEKGPGHTLATVAAAYSGSAPEAIRLSLTEVLRKVADDHKLTQPMADLLLRLDPKALDSVFGRDIAADIDSELGLAAGMSGRVLQALAGHISYINDPQVRRAIDRSAQALPVVPFPDYGGWSGPGVLAAQIISGSLVRAGLAAPDRATPEEYLADMRALWTPDLERLERLAA